MLDVTKTVQDNITSLKNVRTISIVAATAISANKQFDEEGEQAAGGETKTVTMTQEEYDRKFNDSFGKGASKAEKTLLSDLGLDNIDSLKTIVTSHKESEEKNKTELQKANETITTLQSTIDGLNGKVKGLETTSTINSLAAKHGITEVDYFNYEYDKASKVEGFNADEFVTGLVKDKGALLGVKTGNTNTSVHNPGNRQQSEQGGETITMSKYSMLSAEERAKYKPGQIVKG